MDSSSSSEDDENVEMINDLYQEELLIQHAIANNNAIIQYLQIPKLGFGCLQPPPPLSSRRGERERVIEEKERDTQEERDERERYGAKRGREMMSRAFDLREFSTELLFKFLMRKKKERLLLFIKEGEEPRSFTLMGSR